MFFSLITVLSLHQSFIAAPMPNKYKKRTVKPRGVSNRNRGLAWIRKNATDGVFYFADDDNTYDLEIFNQMRYTKKVSMWPVGLVTKYGLSSPIVRNGTLAGFYDGWIGGRKYPVDMAGFAVNVQFFLSRPKAIMPYDAGYEEDRFLKSLAPLHNSEIELLAANCTEVKVFVCLVQDHKGFIFYISVFWLLPTRFLRGIRKPKRILLPLH